MQSVPDPMSPLPVQGWLVSQLLDADLFAFRVCRARGQPGIVYRPWVGLWQDLQHGDVCCFALLCFIRVLELLCARVSATLLLVLPVVKTSHLCNSLHVRIFEFRFGVIAIPFDGYNPLRLQTGRPD